MGPGHFPLVLWGSQGTQGAVWLLGDRRLPGPDCIWAAGGGAARVATVLGGEKGLTQGYIGHKTEVFDE